MLTWRHEKDKLIDDLVKIVESKGHYLLLFAVVTCYKIQLLLLRVKKRKVFWSDLICQYCKMFLFQRT